MLAPTIFDIPRSGRALTPDQGRTTNWSFASGPFELAPERHLPRESDPARAGVLILIQSLPAILRGAMKWPR